MSAQGRLCGLVGVVLTVSGCSVWNASPIPGLSNRSLDSATKAAIDACEITANEGSTDSALSQDSNPAGFQRPDPDTLSWDPFDSVASLEKISAKWKTLATHAEVAAQEDDQWRALAQLSVENYKFVAQVLEFRTSGPPQTWDALSQAIPDGAEQSSRFERNIDEREVICQALLARL